MLASKLMLTRALACGARAAGGFGLAATAALPRLGSAAAGVGLRPLASDAAPASGNIYDVGSSSNIRWHESGVSRADRERALGQRGCVLWLTGLSGSGKSTVAFTLEHALHRMGKSCYVLDGDNVRHGLNHNLGFAQADREENVRRISEVAKLFAESGVITVVSLVSPYRKDRDAARARMAAPSDFVEVHMHIPLDVCEERDPKGLYKLARQGKLENNGTSEHASMRCLDRCNFGNCLFV